MGAFNSELFDNALFNGGGAGTGGGIVSTPVSDLIYDALRRAGVTLGPDRTPSRAQYNDGLRAGNRMLGRWNADGLIIPNITIEAFALTAGLATYTMGPDGDFATTRPQRIAYANLLRADGTRVPIAVVEVDRWADIRTQDQDGEPERLYSDRAAGLVNLYFWPQTTASDDQAELYSWKLLERLVNIAQTVTWADGYELAFVTNLAIQLALMFKRPIDQDMRDAGRDSLYAIRSLNAPAPTMDVDPAFQSQPTGGSWDYRTNE